MTFHPVGMRTKIEAEDAWVVNTCAQNDTSGLGDDTHWVWCNPTNRTLTHTYADIEAVSVECLWQGTKIRNLGDRPDPLTLAGDWRRGKGKRPIGAWAGPDQPLITNPGDARRAIYIPAFRNLIEHQLTNHPHLADLLKRARQHGNVYLRDFDTGQGIDRNGPMSHAWLLASWLNEGDFQ